MNGDEKQGEVCIKTSFFKKEKNSYLLIFVFSVPFYSLKTLKVQLHLIIIIIFIKIKINYN